MKKVVLLVLDGWGIAPSSKGNAIRRVSMPKLTVLWKKFPSTQLHASGKHVGLLPGYIGNSEVGHLHLGAGRLIEQDLVQILKEIKNKKFFKNKVLITAMNKAKKSSLHLLGLLSDAGVHSHIDHLFGILDMAKKRRVENVYVHVITDGRDVSPTSALSYIRKLEKKLRTLNKQWKIATVIGRYYAMDRDNRWSRERKAYTALVNGEGVIAKTASQAVKQSYTLKETDEFIKPTIIKGTPRIIDDDVVIFFNFRSDRAREITKAFVQKKFRWFNRKKRPKTYFVCLTQFDPSIVVPVVYPPDHLKNTLGEVIAKKELRQYRLAETNKWAHVTYFFNGQSGTIFDRESRLLIQSPKVSTYDKRPEMSVEKLTKRLEKVIPWKKYSFILVNFANADMIGHTGKIGPAMKAVKKEGECVSRVADACLKNDYVLIITADHGNAEQMIKNGKVWTAHTTNKVPFAIVSNDPYGKYALKKKQYSLYNVAPTILDIMEITKPLEMAESMLRKA